MPTVTAEYLGNLRSTCTHVASGATILTDAPVDNHGKGEAFSPTDLCATALGTCAMTVMAIYAEQNGLDITGMRLEITKIMGIGPRRITAVEVVCLMPQRPYSAEDKSALEKSMHACPMCYSLHPDIKVVFDFRW